MSIFSFMPFNSFLAVFLFSWIICIDGFVPTDPGIQFIPTRIGSKTRTSPLSVASKIPSSIAERDKQAIQAIRSSLDRVSYPLIECEFPVLQSLNKLGDGSLRSTIEAQEANLAFIKKLVQELNGFMGFGKPSTLVMSSSASNAYFNQARNKVEKVISLKDGMFTIKKKEVYIFLTPSSKADFKIANDLAKDGVPVVIVNAFAKDQKSIPENATMAFYYKPLTYNSQVAGYLIRSYPSDWTVLDAVSKEVLKTFTDDQILVKNTNTPDLRQPGKLVQKSVDLRAIRARGSTS